MVTLSHCKVLKDIIVAKPANLLLCVSQILKDKHKHNYLKEGIFEALQGGTKFKVCYRTEPIQKDYIIHNPPMAPLVFGCIWQLCFNLIHSDSGVAMIKKIEKKTTKKT